MNQEIQRMDYLDVVRQNLHIERRIQPRIARDEEEILQSACVHIGVPLDVVSERRLLGGVGQEGGSEVGVEHAFHCQSGFASQVPQLIQNVALLSRYGR